VRFAKNTALLVIPKPASSARHLLPAISEFLARNAAPRNDNSLEIFQTAPLPEIKAIHLHVAASCKIKCCMAAFIEAVELRKTYRVGKIDVPALRGISFSVERGEFVSIVGPSGSGKSTLFYLLGGLTRSDSGHVVIDGVDFAQLSDSERTSVRKHKIGFVFQKFNLLPTLDARSNIEIAIDIAGANGNRDRAYFDRILHLLGLEKRLNHRPSELSGGEQQRVALARALINKPAIVLADEPTGNLDSKNSEVVLNMLRHSNKELGQTVLMITHNPAAAEYGDRIVHMRDGEIVAAGDDPQWTGHSA
jgi:putative ABC transport system ATP-binding protein